MSHDSIAAQRDCQTRLDLVGDYIEGSLDEATSAEIEAHLAGCPDCRIVVNSLTNTLELYRRLPATQLSGSAGERLLRVLELDSNR
jgi:predicted anti-sigma-YlaC factor YlaD